MDLALWLVALVAVVLAATALSRRLDLPAPLTLVALGIGFSFLPFVPEVRLTSELVLVGLLPPLLYSAALRTSLVDVNANRRPILLLAVGLVGFTTAGVAVVVRLVIPDLPWPAAFALGAVVAPPDAVAATTIARRVGLPRRIVTILEGESLLNDATALVALRTAILAASGAVSVAGVALDFLVAAGGGILVGLAVFALVGWLRRHVVDPVLDTSVSITTPFLAYVVAELASASGVLATVIAGVLLSHQAPVLQTASSRVAERLNWRTISFLLENSVFLLIGLQARWVLRDAARSGLPLATIAAVCGVTLAAVVVLRLVWVFPARYLLTGGSSAAQRPPWTYTGVIGWAGMRGAVTLAAAFAIPPGFTHRSVLVLVALAVTAGTLFLHGLSLPWLVRRLGVPTPDPRHDALARAALFEQATAAGLAQLERHSNENDPYATVAALRRRVEQRDFAAWEELGDAAKAETPSETYARLRLEMLQAERAKVLDVRSTGQLAHSVLEEVLTALDVEESMLDRRSERVTRHRAAGDEHGQAPALLGGCEHLSGAQQDPEPNVEGACEDCLVEGTAWVHLRLCLECGHVGCCDSSPRRHAAGHFRRTGHPVMRSAEAGESWRWCFVDSLLG